MPDMTLNVHVEPEPSKHPPRTEHIGKLGPDTVALYIESKDSDTSHEPVIIAIKQEGLLGRYSPRNRAQPILDLTPYGAFQKGVSRAHANLHRDKNDQLTIEDLGSANGTYINGTRLDSYKLYPLTSGDWIALGRLGIEIYFESSPHQQSISTPALASMPSVEPVVAEPSSDDRNAAEAATRPIGIRPRLRNMSFNCCSK